MADLLVRRGVPFREAHGVVAGLVRMAVDQGKPLSELNRDELAAQSPVLDEEFYAVLRDGAWLESDSPWRFRYLTHGESTVWGLTERIVYGLAPKLREALATV